MIELIHTINFLLPILYVITFSFYLISFFKSKKNFSVTKKLFLFVTLLVHLTYILLRTIEFKHAPITNLFEIFTLLALAITTSYYLIEILTEIRNTGLFILFLPLIFQLISSMCIKDLLEIKEILKTPYLGIHVATALTGYAGITISAIYGLLYLLLRTQIKNQKYGLIFNRLPNLEILEVLNVTSAIIGFIMLTIAITIGIIWLPKAFTDPSYFDPKLIATVLVWLFYAFGLSGRWFFKWGGRKSIYFSLIGFAISLFSMSILNLLFTGFHRFF